MPSPRFRVRAIFGFLLLSAILVTSCGGQATQSSNTSTSGSSSGSSSSGSSGTYQLVWSDEFSGADGSAPDSSKWAIQTGGGGWGNNELEYYTSRSQNVQVKGGNLVITAIKENYTGSDGVSRNYTSARMQTKRLFSQQGGRFEASIQIPKGQGMWPAF